jgi:predicted DNA-binding transcriptional regulator AlpA
MEYTFTLKYRLSESDCDHEELIGRLGSAGCDDALIGVGQPGRIALAFTREADSAQAALMSALKDVKSAIPSAALVEALPDFVGLTDVADTIGVTRQNMRKLMLANPATFPLPVHEGSTAIWHLAEVLDWLSAKGTYELEQSVHEIAETTMQVNLTKEAQRLTPQVQRELRPLVK